MPIPTTHPSPKGAPPPSSTQELWTRPGTFNGLPTFFKINLRQTKSGGAWSYRQLGIEVAMAVHRLVPLDFDEADAAWEALVETELGPLLQLYAGKKAPHDCTPLTQIINWVHFRFPTLAGQVPAAKWSNFVTGMISVFPGEMKR